MDSGAQCLLLRVQISHDSLRNRLVRKRTIWAHLGRYFLAASGEHTCILIKHDNKEAIPTCVKEKKTVFKLSIIFQVFNYIRNNTGIVGVLAITVGVAATTTGVSPSRTHFQKSSLRLVEAGETFCGGVDATMTRSTPS